MGKKRGRSQKGNPGSRSKKHLVDDSNAMDDEIDACISLFLFFFPSWCVNLSGIDSMLINNTLFAGGSSQAERYYSIRCGR